MEQTQILVLCERDRCVLRLRGTLGVAEAEELRRAALQVAGNATDARIEWNETEQIDASVLQVLVSLKAEVAAAGRALSVGPAGAAIATYLQTAGLSSDLSVGAAA